MMLHILQGATASVILGLNSTNMDNRDIDRYIDQENSKGHTHQDEKRTHGVVRSDQVARGSKRFIHLEFSYLKLQKFENMKGKNTQARPDEKYSQEEFT